MKRTELVRKKPMARSRAPKMAANAPRRTAISSKRKSVPVAEKEYMGRVAALGCAICRRLGYGETPAQVHHQRTGIGKGQRASNYQTVPLCPEHHTGNTGFHTLGRRFALVYGVTEVELVEETQRILGYSPDAMSAAVTADAKTAASTGVRSLGSRLINQ